MNTFWEGFFKEAGKNSSVAKKWRLKVLHSLIAKDKKVNFAGFSSKGWSKTTLGKKYK